MRAVVLSLIVLCVLGCKEKEEGFELNERRMAELASATCSCSDSVSNDTCAIAYGASLANDLLAQVKAGRVQVDTKLWADCIAELRACKAPDVCERLFIGTIPEDGECISTQECAPGTRCVPKDPTEEKCAAAGKCEAIEKFERGERCTLEGECEGDDICGVDLSSDGGEPDEDDDAGAEASDPDAGAAGDGDDAPSQAFVCQKPLDKGDVCPVSQPGGTNLCEAGTSCVPDDGKIVCGDPVAAGKPCTFGPGLEAAGFAKCTNGNFCNPASGVCEPFDFPDGSDIGEDCEMRSDCLPGLVCVDDECARPLPNGSACDGDDQCAAQCFDEHCAPTYVACGIQ